MDMNSIIIAAVVIAAVGIIVGVGPGLFGAKFKVEVDEKRQLFVKSCQATTVVVVVIRAVMVFAKAIAEGKAPVNACPVGGAPVGEKIACYHGCRGWFL